MKVSAGIGRHREHMLAAGRAGDDEVDRSARRRPDAHIGAAAVLQLRAYREAARYACVLHGSP
jgi:hypothetical protein